MKRCRGEGAHPHARKGGGVQRAKLVPCLSAPGADRNSLPRARTPEAARWLKEPLRLQDPASPCLPRPRVPPPVSPLLRSEGQRASGAAQPGLPPAGRHQPHTSARPARPGHFAQFSRRRRARTLTRTPLHLFPKVSVPGFPEVGTEPPRPPRQSLRLTSPGGGGRGRGREPS